MSARTIWFKQVFIKEDTTAPRRWCRISPVHMSSPSPRCRGDLATGNRIPEDCTRCQQYKRGYGYEDELLHSDLLCKL